MTLALRAAAAPIMTTRFAYLSVQGTMESNIRPVCDLSTGPAKLCPTWQMKNEALLRHHRELQRQEILVKYFISNLFSKSPQNNFILCTKDPKWGLYMS